MSDVLEMRLRQVRWRCWLNLLLEQMAWVGVGMAGLALVLLLLARLLALPVWLPITGYSLVGLFAVLVLGLWAVKIPGKMQLSLIVDERLRLYDRFSTTLALSQSETPFAQAARAEAQQIIDTCEVASRFPVRPTRTWRWALSTWLAVIILVLVLPQKDLLGFLKRQQQQVEEKARVELVKNEIKDSTVQVKRALYQLDDPNLAEDINGLADLPASAEPQIAKRQAIAKLTNLSDKLKQQQTSLTAQSLDLLRKRLKQLRGSPQTLSRELHMAMARGQFDKAAQLLKDMQQKLRQGNLSDKDKQALSQQLQDLARQMAKLADSNRQLEEDLEKLGLPKELAKLNSAELQKALQKKGLSNEEIAEMMKKMAAARLAANRCSGLGKALGACGAGGGMSAEDLAMALQEFSDLDDLLQQSRLSDAAIAELDRAIACLGEGMCEGLGGQSPFRTGDSNKYGNGSGGPGRGYGERARDTEGDVTAQKRRVKTQAKDGPVIASWYVKGDQIKGEASQQFKDVVVAGRDSAAEAIQDNQIPKKYEQSVKSYFGRLEAEVSDTKE
jgi:hypothetical protein